MTFGDASCWLDGVTDRELADMVAAVAIKRGRNISFDAFAEKSGL